MDELAFRSNGNRFVTDELAFRSNGSRFVTDELAFRSNGNRFVTNECNGQNFLDVFNNTNNICLFSKTINENIVRVTAYR